MSYKPQSLFRLINDMNKGIFLPHIQRPFVWEEEQMLRLFDSLMRSYPIQTLLFWRTNDAIKARKFLDEVSWDIDLSDYYDAHKSQQGVEKTFVLDGQQRLQSLYAIFAGSLSGPDGTRQEAYFDVTSGEQSDDQSLLYKLQFEAKNPGLPWYRVADLIAKDAQRNAEELADSLNAKLDKIEESLSQEARRTRERRVRKKHVATGLDIAS